MIKCMRFWAAILFFVLVSLPVSRAQQKAAPQTPRPIVESEIQALILAIQDEVYGHDSELEFFDLANAEGGVDLPVYIEPTITAGDNAIGTAIYKLMPYGEVIRCFSIVEGGLAVLCDKPENDFLPTGENMKTQYLQDDNVIKWKQTWIAQRFRVLFHPPAERVREASKRQKIRARFWDTESSDDKRKRSEDERHAAKTAIASGGNPDGPVYFFQAREGLPPDRRPAWAKGAPAQRFGPFISSGGGQVPNGARFYIETFRAPGPGH